MDTPLLIGVFPFEHTVFNVFQMQKQLPRENEYLRGKLTDAESISMLDELDRLLLVAKEGQSEGYGRYLWFIGD